jgi:hypothetical protein
MTNQPTAVSLDESVVEGLVSLDLQAVGSLPYDRLVIGARLCWRMANWYPTNQRRCHSVLRRFPQWH